MPIAPNFGGGGGDAGGGFGGPGGSGSGGGAGGGSGSPTVTIAQPGPGQGGAAMMGNRMFSVVRLTADRTEYGPAIQLTPDDDVYVWPKRSNTTNVFVATDGNSDAKFDPRIELQKTDNPISVTVRSLREIGVYSVTVGDGVIIVVRRRP